MNNRQQVFLSARFIIGIAAVVFGIALLLDNLDYMNAHAILRYWPVVLIALGIARMAHPHTGRGGWFIAGTFILVGTILLLHTLGFGEIGLNDLWPLILVLLGGSLILGSAGRTKTAARNEEPADSSMKESHSLVNGVAILSEVKRSENSKEFRGGDLVAIMGACEVDLRQAGLAENEVFIDTFAFWGGIKIKVPPAWNVVIQGFPFLGGYDDKTVKPTDPSAQRLVIKGTVIMGGVEIIN